jgi:mannose/fructose-specific phosphotransferase system component IIA
VNASENTIGLVFAAHAPIGDALARAAAGIVGLSGPLLNHGIAIADLGNSVADADQAIGAITHAIDQVSGPQGILVMADLFGGSAANLAFAHLAHGRVEVITGLNLPMALEALTKRPTCSSPQALAQVAARAARESIVVGGELLGLDSPSEQVALA